jgi:HEAT repeat protein
MLKALKNRRQLKEKERKLKEHEDQLTKNIETLKCSTLKPSLLLMEDGNLGLMPGIDYGDIMANAQYRTAYEELLTLIPLSVNNRSKTTIDCLIDLIDKATMDILKECFRSLLQMSSKEELSKNFIESLTRLRKKRNDDPGISNSMWIGNELGLILCLIGLKDRQAIAIALKSAKINYVREYIISNSKDVGILFDNSTKLSSDLNDSDQDKRIEALEKLSEMKKLDLIINALHNEHYDVRCKAALELGKIGDKIAVEPLIEALNDNISGAEAASALGKIGDKKAVIPLINQLKWRHCESTDSWFHNESIEALGILCDKQAVPCLKKIFEDSMTESIRKCTARSLKKLGVSISAFRYHSLALKDYDSGVRAKAAKNLGRLGDKRATKFLQTAFNDKHYIVRKNAAKSLRKLKIQVSMIEFYTKSLQDIECSIREKAAIALAETGDKKAITPLVLALQAEKNIEAEWAFLNALEGLGHNKAPFLISDFVNKFVLAENLDVLKQVFLKINNVSVKKEVLKKIKKQDFFFHVAINDPDPTFRQMAAIKLTSLGHLRAVVQNESDSSVRNTVEKRLTEFNNKEIERAKLGNALKEQMVANGKVIYDDFSGFEIVDLTGVLCPNCKKFVLRKKYPRDVGVDAKDWNPFAVWDCAICGFSINGPV